MDSPSIFADNLPKTAANYVPLSPLSYLRRFERVFPNKTAVTHHAHSWTYAQFAGRCRRLTAANPEKPPPRLSEPHNPVLCPSTPAATT